MPRAPEPNPRQTVARQALAQERESLRAQLFDWFDPVLIALGLVTAALLLVEFAMELSPRQAAWVGRAQQIIWVIFVIEFAVQFTLAPSKLRYLRGHWLAAISVALPALRAFRILRAARALRSLRLVRLIGGTNRAVGALRVMLRGRQFGYLVALTILVVMAGATGGYVFERGNSDATIQTLGDALWWATCMVTTINNEKFAVTVEGRVLAVLLRVYAVGIFGLIAGNIASYFVGKRQEEAAAAASIDDLATTAPTAAVLEELRRLREEVRSLSAQRLDLKRIQPTGGTEMDEHG